MEKKIPPDRFKRLLVRLFFNHLEKGTPEKIVQYVQEYDQRGLDTSCFYWMDSSLRPTSRELSDILSGPDFGFSKEEVSEYQKRYDSILGSKY